MIEMDLGDGQRVWMQTDDDLDLSGPSGSEGGRVSRGGGG